MAPPKAKPLLSSTIPFLLLLLLLLCITTTTSTTEASAKVDVPIKETVLSSTRRSTEEAARYHCQSTLYPELCVSTVSSIPHLSSKTLPEIISSIVKRTEHEVHFASHNCTGSLRSRFRNLEHRQRLALLDCLELLSETLDLLRGAASDLRSSNSSTTATLSHLQTVLSASMTNQYTCLDGFSHDANDTVRPSIAARINHISSMVSNALALSTRLPKKEDKEAPFEGYGRFGRHGFPSWLSKSDRRLLQTDVARLNVDLVVAKDGTGNFTTIAEAVESAPEKSERRFVIYIKAGGYFENVEVPKRKTNLMFVGEGMWATAVKASRSVVDGWTTFRSATVAVVGKGFLARDMSFYNMAGPEKHQAVALRSGADLSAFYRCAFVGYQDTLYVHSLRQFYRDCEVYGTVDFVFGDAAAVLQRCNLWARRPNPKQKNIFTAQGRKDPNQNTGISLQGCKLAAASDLVPVQSDFRTYLGRPWKEYSRTVVMQSQLDDVIDPAGWLEWDGDFALDTLYYGEFMNFGAGSGTSERVTWKGYRVITNATEALEFAPGPFIQADEWLPGSMVPYISGFV